MLLIRMIILTLILAVLSVTYSFAKQNSEVDFPGIVINLPSRTLEFYSGDRMLREYPVGIGKPSTPTPRGNYSIIYKEVNPAWYPPDEKGKVVPSGPDNPLGYRWIGIWSTYGIHGTNAPWSIGSAVSNGCIRMYEPDVEELFELVGYGTPVKITYDRVKVKIDNQGQVIVRLFPDIYHHGGNISNVDVRGQLDLYRLNGFISDAYVRKIIDEKTDKPTVIARLFTVKVNNQILKEKGIAVENVRYIPAAAVAEYFKAPLAWDDSAKLIRFGKKSVPGLLSGKTMYVSESNLGLLLDGQSSWREEERCLTFNKITVYLNDKPISLGVKKIDSMLVVPALDLAETLGYLPQWDSVQQVFTLKWKRNTMQVPIKLIGSDPYICITNINEYYNTHVYWDEQANSIELTYPAP